MPSPALPSGILALLYHLVEPEEETAILEGRKDGKSTSHHPAISWPASSPESFKIALEDHRIEGARITGFDPKQTETGSGEVSNIRRNGSQAWIGPVNGNQPVLSIRLWCRKQVLAPSIQVTEGLREPLKHVEQDYVVLPQSQEALSNGNGEDATE